jgi:competence protein ComEC
MRVANRARAAVLDGTGMLPATERALLAGFLLGDTRALPDALVDDFRDAGLSHLLAVSGANVAFVLALAAPVLGRTRLGARCAGGVALLVLFGTMTRWEPSVLRASAMAGLALLATFLGRPASGRRLLVLAVTGLLLLDPFLVHSIGFLLSAGASAGIVLLAPSIGARLPGPRPVADALGVTAAAQLGVLPVLVPVFGTVPLVALPANLLAAPVVGPLTVWGLVAGVAGGILGPGVAHWLQVPTYALLRFVEAVARTAARTPFAVDGRGLWGLLAVACLVAGLLRVRKIHPGRLGRDAPVPPR